MLADQVRRVRAEEVRDEYVTPDPEGSRDRDAGEEDAVPDVKDAGHECRQDHRGQEVVAPEETVTLAQGTPPQILEAARMVEQPAAAPAPIQ